MVTIITLRCLLCIARGISELRGNTTTMEGSAGILKERCFNLKASDVFSIKCNVAGFNGCEDMLKQHILRSKYADRWLRSEDILAEAEAIRLDEDLYL
ncbi:hypothetical protein NCU06064 [Neurospora crassa OR74A]|uniref:Uncharacterized protein n=1 Tax=Neurospora crassa (strain ATCC 24698 / 74-OR23-1A / CBS 708.71 / DSM 1257 / FGSC 987) TaxID=367110 RepID=Q7S4Y6_NEUCR|nr:hypothetical protein NCU06064 [Neurospora crassa OR74A]EAA30591.2 hypothetical protein NCU06064 [Neurospora crassa OR74A]|eukprot:XP_959827.2 hypothetical protein NCU06064 [Neurospora crassa OR74A]